MIMEASRLRRSSANSAVRMGDTGLVERASGRSTGCRCLALCPLPSGVWPCLVEERLMVSSFMITVMITGWGPGR